MPERVTERDVPDLIDEINQKLKQFKIDYSGMTLRDKVKRLVDIGYDSKCLGVNVVVDHGYDIKAALSRLRQYLIENLLIVIQSTELEVVSGISEYARRVRQLRVEEGFKILTGASPDPAFSALSLKPDQYVLVSKTPDLTSARRWIVANRIRKSKKSSKDRILEYLLENVMQVVTTEELSYVSGDKKEFARRTRELRTEEGYAIATKITGRPDLQMGEYILLSADRIAEPHDRHITLDTQREVYQRDKNACRACAWDVSKFTKSDPRILELHHLDHHKDRGENSAFNLIVICSKCHDKVHAGTLKIDHIKNEDGE